MKKGNNEKTVSTETILTEKEFKKYKTEFDEISDYYKRIVCFNRQFKDYGFKHFSVFAPHLKTPSYAESKDIITIFPKDIDQRKIYFHWLSENSIENNFEAMKLNIEEKLKQSPKKLELLRREKNRVKEIISFFTGSPNKYGTRLHEKIYANFKQGYDSIIEVKEIDFSNENKFLRIHDYLEVIRGSVMAEYEGFLDNYQIDSIVNQCEKIKFNGSPSVFAYLMKELAEKGFINYPLKNGEINFTGFCKMLTAHFDLDSSESNLIQEFKPSSGSLSETKKAKFTIPELKDLK